MAGIDIRIVRGFIALTCGGIILSLLLGCESYRTDGLIRDLGAKEPEVRLNAATELAGSKDPRVVLPLIAALKDKDPHVPARAAESLTTLGTIAVDPLIGVLRDKKAASWPAVVRILGKIGDIRSIEPLFEALSDSDTAVSAEVREALVAVLIAALRNGSVPVRLKAAGSLRELPDPKAVSPLIAALKDSDANVRQRAAAALGNIGAEAAEALMKLLKDPDPEMRRVAAEQLGRIRPLGAVEPLLGALRDPDGNVRWWSAWALGEIGEPAEKPLRGLLSAPDPETRRWVKEALNKIRGMPFDAKPSLGK